MAEPQRDSTLETSRRGTGKRAAAATTAPVEVELVTTPAAVAPCGACKFLRRKCTSACIFAPYFGSDQGAARFAAVHKVFGASNVSKLLLHIPVNRRGDAVVTISYEAQARLSDPVYGCVSTIFALQQQVTTLQAEVAMVQNHLINSKFAMENALQNSQHHLQQPPQHVAALQPAYSNSSYASTNFMSSTFPSNFDLVANAAPSSQQCTEPLLMSWPKPAQEDEEDEEESRIPAINFANQIIRMRS